MKTSGVKHHSILLSLLKVKDSLITGVKEIFYHPLRSSLTLLGITLGVASLIAMTGIMDGFKQTFIEYSNSQGGNSRISINNLNDQEKAALAQTGKVKGITAADVPIIIQKHSDIIDHIIPQVTVPQVVVTRGNKSVRLWNWSLIGTTPDYPKVDNMEQDEGRNLTPIDDISLSRVCLIASIVKYELFSDYESPIGQKVDVNGVSFTVVGTFKHQYAQPVNVIQNAKEGADVLKRIAEKQKIKGVRLPTRALNLKKIESVQNVWGRQLWEKYGKGNAVWQKNLKVIIPLSTFQTLFKQDDVLDTIEIRFKSSDNLAGKIEMIKEALKKKRNGVEDFKINPWSEMFEDANKQIGLLRTVFLFITVISLCVGGIGTMNVILASISERIREIGVRKSVGARNVDIFVQFLIETIVLAVFGGILGTIIGPIIAFGLGKYAALRIIISWYAILLAIGVSSVVGLLSGLYPAFKASRMNPIDALRYE